MSAHHSQRTNETRRIMSEEFIQTPAMRKKMKKKLIERRQDMPTGFLPNCVEIMLILLFNVRAYLWSGETRRAIRGFLFAYKNMKKEFGKDAPFTLLYWIVRADWWKK